MRFYTKHRESDSQSEQGLSSGFSMHMNPLRKLVKVSGREAPDAGEPPCLHRRAHIESGQMVHTIDDRR